MNPQMPLPFYDAETRCQTFQIPSSLDVPINIQLKPTKKSTKIRKDGFDQRQSPSANRMMSSNYNPKYQQTGRRCFTCNQSHYHDWKQCKIDYIMRTEKQDTNKQSGILKESMTNFSSNPRQRLKENYQKN